MAKLFLAFDLPIATIAELVRLQPKPMPGMRVVDPGQMHVTLHFIGAAQHETLAAELLHVSVPSFAIAVRGVGQFPSAGGSVTLFAGVEKSVELLGLHDALADALKNCGFQPEARPYSPHVTLARCEPPIPEKVVADFLTQHASLSAPVERFGVYSSSTVNGVPFYQCQQWFPLRTANWSVHRQDDNGNRFVVKTGLTREEAERLAAEFEARGHKQLYWTEPDR